MDKISKTPETAKDFTTTPWIPPQSIQAAAMNGHPANPEHTQKLPILNATGQSELRYQSPTAAAAASAESRLPTTPTEPTPPARTYTAAEKKMKINTGSFKPIKEIAIPFDSKRTQKVPIIRQEKKPK